MKEIVIATENKGKIAEFKQLLKGWEVRSLLDYPQIPEIIENGETFAENAAIKAETLANHLNCIVIADDSGLEVDAYKVDQGCIQLGMQAIVKVTRPICEKY
ncbi:nucleoside 5-triphosphatase RdgB [Halalkalibacter wakoensis JCM 9140]|uniref:Nucleoside 5-triphosphatase RdgB n=1 Tax=Halalkalibacter wakoensis JCM 9140 TaxID=1236970 RepID=W4Q370_9BACI|nr:nucleoside 5-triphosphatase RdgB [Halalkalibacter wakoensis JCM 9140]